METYFFLDGEEVPSIVGYGFTRLNHYYTIMVSASFFYVLLYKHTGFKKSSQGFMI